MRYAIVENGIVVNIAVSTHPLTAQWICIPTGCTVAIGDKYEGGLFYSPEGQVRMTPEAQMIISRFLSAQKEDKA